MLLARVRVGAPTSQERFVTLVRGEERRREEKKRIKEERLILI